MKIFGSDKNGGFVFVTMKSTEWDELQRACSVPYDKRNDSIGAQADAAIIRQAIDALDGMKTVRKELGQMMKKWDALATKVDSIMGESK